MIDQAFRDETIDRLARLETTLESLQKTQSTIDLKLDALRITIVEGESKKVARSVLIRTSGHIVTGLVSMVAALIAISTGVVPHGR